MRGLLRKALGLNQLMGVLRETRNTSRLAHEVALQRAIEERQRAHPNPLVRHGRRCYSQSDEDGITQEIVRRLGIAQGVFAEFGVGNGMQNNTLALMACGWRGFWVGGEDLAFDVSGSERLHFEKAWTTLENIQGLYEAGLARLDRDGVDVLSLDLDGNDYFFLEKLLQNDCRPSLFIVEYNGRFPPPLEFCIDYDPAHEWKGGDYHGASLATLAGLFEIFGYVPICCNAGTGANAFFVRKDARSHFPEVPERLEDIFVPPLYVMQQRYGHPKSLRTIRKIISD